LSVLFSVFKASDFFRTENRELKAEKRQLFT